jgi:hypothetical protein
MVCRYVLSCLASASSQRGTTTDDRLCVNIFGFAPLSPDILKKEDRNSVEAIIGTVVACLLIRLVWFLVLGSDSAGAKRLGGGAPPDVQGKLAEAFDRKPATGDCLSAYGRTRANERERSKGQDLCWYSRWYPKKTRRKSKVIPIAYVISPIPSTAPHPISLWEKGR